jgi:hypothetical protein
MYQYEIVISTIEKLGGVATLGQLYREVLKNQDFKFKGKTPARNINRIVQLQTKDIYKIRPGLYGLVKDRERNESKGLFEVTDKNKDSEEIIEFNHTYYQGLVLEIGNLRKYSTYSPEQDKNKKFLDKTLGEIRTLTKIPDFSYEFFINRSKTVDVIWFNERNMPASFFEIEHTGQFLNALVKLNDLQDFAARMIIVADRVRRNEFEKNRSFSSFKEITKRVEFLSYEQLIKQYEVLNEKMSYETIII